AVSYLDRTDLAHVKPEGAAFDDLGGGSDEGQSNVAEPSERTASKSLEVLKQVASSGYMRKRLPQELVVLQGGIGAMALAGDPVAALNTLVPATAKAVISGAGATTALASGTVSLDARTKAKMQGYEGDPCGECGNYTLVRNGTCMKCNTCGGTSGCS
ncbi:MAG: vitamin B12-dependent ribonucleotide reductase, partial [Rhodobacteraceae bacterium]|nr:vitamin B12-dependent ribonucleotide reductase [Paracoccaceae bacterium]